MIQKPAIPEAVPLVPWSLFPVPYSLFPVPALHTTPRHRSTPPPAALQPRRISAVGYPVRHSFHVIVLGSIPNTWSLLRELTSTLFDPASYSRSSISRNGSRPIHIHVLPWSLENKPLPARQATSSRQEETPHDEFASALSAARSATTTAPIFDRTAVAPYRNHQVSVNSHRQIVARSHHSNT